MKIANLVGNSSMNTLDKLSEEFESNIATIRTPQIKSDSQPGERNLLHRFLRFKPETRVLILAHNRRATRHILSQLILTEEHRGIRDLARDLDNRNSFTGRLDKHNAWGMKPVWFVLELFAILRDGRTSKITAVRFTQESGSAQSLRKLVDMLAGRLQGGHLHGNAKEAKEIASLIKNGRAEIRDC
jgi:hypothetical protein